MDSCQTYYASLQFAMIKKLLLCIALQNVTILQIDKMRYFEVYIAGSLEAAYSLNWGAREIWGKGGGETLAVL